MQSGCLSDGVRCLKRDQLRTSKKGVKKLEKVTFRMKKLELKDIYLITIVLLPNL